MNPVDERIQYQIRLLGHLDSHWLRWFEGLDVTLLAEGDTLVSGAMDQSALHGILNRIRDLGLEIISIQRTPKQNEF